MKNDYVIKPLHNTFSLDFGRIILYHETIFPICKPYHVFLCDKTIGENMEISHKHIPLKNRHLALS